MTIVYLAGKLRGPDYKSNINTARQVAKALWETGWFSVVCPHLNCPEDDHKAMDDDLALGTYIPGHIAIMERCDCLVVMLNWEESKGAVAEVRAAMEVGMPVWEWLGGDASEPFLRRVGEDRVMGLGAPTHIPDLELELDSLMEDMKAEMPDTVRVNPSPVPSRKPHPDPDTRYLARILAPISKDHTTILRFLLHHNGYTAIGTSNYQLYRDLADAGYVEVVNPAVCNSGAGSCVYQITPAGRDYISSIPS